MPEAARQLEVLSSTDQWLSLLVPCALSCGEDALARVSQSKPWQNLPLTDTQVEHFAAALREVLWNAIEHGGQLDANKQIRLDVLRTSRSLACLIRDPGPGFRLAALKHAAINNPPDDTLQHAMVREAEGLRPGGFGILLAQAYVDELIYNEAGNEVVLIRYLDSK